MVIYLAITKWINWEKFWLSIPCNKTSCEQPGNVFLVPDASSSMRWQRWLSLYPLRGILTIFDPLCKIPQVEIDHYTAHVHAALLPRRLRVFHLGDLLPNLFDGEDARRADTQLFPRAVRDGTVAVEDLDERRRVIKYAEVMQDLWDAVVSEHRQLVDTRGEERVGV